MTQRKAANINFEEKFGIFNGYVTGTVQLIVRMFFLNLKIKRFVLF